MPSLAASLLSVWIAFDGPLAERQSSNAEALRPREAAWARTSVAAVFAEALKMISLLP
jgi:hypothetical protein